MEDVLDVYELSYNPQKPVVCIDEKPYQLLSNAREGFPMCPGDDQKIDSEYIREGIQYLCLYRATWRNPTCERSGTPHSIGTAKRLGVQLLFSNLFYILLPNL